MLFFSWLKTSTVHYWYKTVFSFTHPNQIKNTLTFLIQCCVIASLARSSSIARRFSFCHFFQAKDAMIPAITMTDSSTTPSTRITWLSASARMGSAVGKGGKYSGSFQWQDINYSTVHDKHNTEVISNNPCHQVCNG